MKNTLRKTTSILLAVIMIFGIFTIVPFNVSAVTNHTRDEAVSWAKSQVGKYIDVDGAYGNQCVDLIMAYYQYLGVSRVPGNGCDYAYNSLPDGWSRIQNTPSFVPEPGDIVVWTNAGWEYGHVAIFISGDTNSFTSIDQNWPVGSACKQVSHNYNYVWGVIRPSFNNSGNNPIGTVDSITGSTNAINVRGWVFDKDDISKSLDIHVYIGGPAGSGAEGHSIVADQYRPDVNSVYGVGDYHGFSSTIYTNLSGNQEVFIYGINTMGGSNVLLGSQTVYIDRDLYKPVIQKIYITDVTPYAFTVNAVISDDRGVSEVKFPTWKDGSPDVKWYIPEHIDANTYSYRVHINDLTNEPGVYHTHVYAYDVGRNESVGSIDIIVPDKGVLIYEIVNGNIHIQGINDKSIKEVEIPSTIDNTIVTEISDYAFSECTNLEKIILPDTITKIGNNAFSECWHLKEFVCPTDLYSIGNDAFSSCYGLSKISFNDKLYSIGSRAFYTTNLSSVYLPISLSSIGEYSLGYKYDENLLPQKCNFKIYGFSNSNSKIYAQNNGIKFIPIDSIGDVNTDGVVNINDATEIQKYLAAIVKISNEQKEVADTNGDGVVNINDATQIQKHLAGISTSLG